MNRREFVAGAGASAILLPSTAEALTAGQRATLLGKAGASITLSNSTVADTATVGTTVGNLAVVGGVGTYTFTLTSNPGGLFAISGNLLQVAAALSAGSDPITVKADNGAGSIIMQPFTITVTSTSVQSEPMPVVL